MTIINRANEDEDLQLYTVTIHHRERDDVEVEIQEHSPEEAICAALRENLIDPANPVVQEEDICWGEVQRDGEAIPTAFVPVGTLNGAEPYLSAVATTPSGEEVTLRIAILTTGGIQYFAAW